jgi:hypothetical protein
MNIFERIKQLKFIEPDASFAERSKRDIFASPVPAMPFRRPTLRRFVVRFFEVGVATALVAVFILIMTGGLSTLPFAPVPFSAVSPTALRVEAQAVDIQIQLATLAYQASAGTTAESTAVTGKKLSAIESLVAPVASSSVAAASSTVSSSLSVDDVLKALSQ